MLMFRNFVSAVRLGLTDPKFRAMGYLVIVLLGSGTVFYRITERWSVLDSLYFSVITLATVGYGDLAPTKTPTKIFTIVYIFIGLGIVFAFFSMIATNALSAQVERRERKKG